MQRKIQNNVYKLQNHADKIIKIMQINCNKMQIKQLHGAEKYKKQILQMLDYFIAYDRNDFYKNVKQNCIRKESYIDTVKYVSKVKTKL